MSQRNTTPQQNNTGIISSIAGAIGILLTIIGVGALMMGAMMLYTYTGGGNGAVLWGIVLAAAIVINILT